MARDVAASAFSQFLDDSVADGDQCRFERAVFAVMYDVACRGGRVERSAEEMLTRHSIGLHDDYVMPDLIICASDCARSFAGLMSGARPDGAAVLAAFAHWRDLPRSGAFDDPRTRIQVCIGNVRRALSLVGVKDRTVGNP